MTRLLLRYASKKSNSRREHRMRRSCGAAKREKKHTHTHTRQSDKLLRRNLESHGWDSRAGRGRSSLPLLPCERLLCSRTREEPIPQRVIGAHARIDPKLRRQPLGGLGRDRGRVRYGNSSSGGDRCCLRRQPLHSLGPPALGHACGRVRSARSFSAMRDSERETSDR